MPAAPGYYAEGPEALVVSLAARGDRDAFTELVRRRQPWLRNLMRRFSVSGRFRMLRNERNWMLHRSLLALYNAEIYLRPKYLFTRNNLRFFLQRRRGLLQQLMLRIEYFGKGR